MRRLLCAPAAIIRLEAALVERLWTTLWHLGMEWRERALVPFDEDVEYPWPKCRICLENNPKNASDAVAHDSSGRLVCAAHHLFDLEDGGEALEPCVQVDDSSLPRYEVTWTYDPGHEFSVSHWEDR